MKALRYALILLSGFVGTAEAQIPSFPGAEGFGAVSVGGRGGDVYHVTSLADTNSQGTLRHAISSAPSSGRTIVFDVSGDIHMTNNISVNRPNITIAGQTAPGKGITLSGASVWLQSNDLIVRHLRNRLGANPANGEDSISINGGNRVILDHASAAWSTDEAVSMTNNSSDNTIQWSLITETLNVNNHSAGSLFRPGANVPASNPSKEFNLSVHHNLYAHSAKRNPIFSTYNEHVINADMRNNVVYNWKDQTTHDGDETSYVRLNYISNFYVAGPSTRGDLVANPSILSAGNPRTSVYFNDDNLVDATRDDGLHNGIWDPTAISVGATAATPYDYPPVTTLSAADAYESVLDYAGAFWWNRDPIDDRVTTDVREISDPSAAVRAQAGYVLTTEADAGGLPALPTESRPAGWDVDGDGMPGHWEVARGLDPNVADHNGDFDNDLYTNLEEYLNEVGAFPSPAVIVFDGDLNGRFARAENWSADWQPSRFDTSEIRGGVSTVDAVGQVAGLVRVAPDLGQSATLDIASGWLEAEAIEVASQGDSGMLNLTGGDLRVGTISKGPSGELNLFSGVLSADVVEFDLENNGATLSPGQGLGETEVLGDTLLSSGVLAIDLASPTESDHLSVDGVLTLGGDLEVSLLDGFAPESGAWMIASAASVAGAFESVTPGFAVSVVDGDLLLSVVSAVTGDYNGDGLVDAADYTLWRDNKGTINTLPNDPIGGEIGPAHYQQWADNYGSSGDAGSHSVPEPSTCFFVLLVGAILLNRIPRAGNSLSL